MSAWLEVIKQTTRIFLTRHRGLIIILFLAFLARVFFLAFMLKASGPEGLAPQVNEDSREYVSIARNLAENGVFSRDSAAPFTPERARTPGYPLFLALFYLISPRLTFLAAVQNIFFLIAIILLYQIILAITANKRMALIASGFLTFEPATLYWNNQLTAESIFAVFLLAAIYCLLLFFTRSKMRFVFYSGFFLGFALLVRPIAQYLYIIFLGGLFIMGFLKKNKWKKILLGMFLFLMGYSSITTPWIIRNKVIFGTTSVSTMKVGFGKYITAMRNELGLSLNYTGTEWKERTEAERLAMVKTEAVKTIARHPLLFAKIHFAGLFPFFLGDGYVTALGAIFPALKDAHIVTNWSGNPLELITFLRGHRGLEGFIFWVGKAVWLAITVLAISGFLRLFRHGGRQRHFAVLIFIMIYYFALASGVGSYSRFRFPVNPFIFYFAAAGIISLKERLIAKRLFFSVK